MRLGINVPDELVKRLEPMKPYINISKLCRDVIYENVMLYEKAKQQTENDDMEIVAKKLLEHIKPIVVDWQLLGLQDAKSWAFEAKIEDWDALFNLLDCFERAGKSLFDGHVPIPRVKGTKTYYDRQYEFDVDNGWFEQHMNDMSNQYVFAQTEYQRGFLTYVIIIRQKIKEKLVTDLKSKEIQMNQTKSDLKANVELPKALR